MTDFFGKMDLSVPIQQNAFLKGLPTRAMVGANVKQWVDFINTNNLQPGSSDFANGKVSADWTVSALKAYGEKVVGVKLPAMVADGITGKVISTAFSLSNASVNTWVTKGAQLGNIALAGMKIPQVPTFASTSIISAGTIAIDAFADGHVDAAEIGPIFQAGGAMAGGIIGSIIPGIGTLIGSAVGAAIGALAGMFGSSALAKAQIKAENAQQIDKIYDWGVSECKKILKQMNEETRQQIAALAHEWLKQEARLGYRFDLRWFDPNPGWAFSDMAYNKGDTEGGPGGSVDDVASAWGRYGTNTSNGCLPKTVNWRGQHSSVPFTWSGSRSDKSCNFYCPSELGCLYPDQSIDRGTTALNEYNAYGAIRVITALRARGFNWPLTETEMCDVAKTSKPNVSADADQWKVYRDKMTSGLKNTAGYHQTRFEIAKKIVSFDLARTTATIESAATVIRDQLSLRTSGTSNSLPINTLAGLVEEHGDRLRMIALLGGGTLLAAALWKASR